MNTSSSSVASLRHRPPIALSASESFESKSSNSSSGKYVYRTPGLSVSRCFEKDIYISSKSVVSLEGIRTRSYPNQRLYHEEDGSDTSATTPDDADDFALGIEDLLPTMSKESLDDSAKEVTVASAISIDIETDKSKDSSENKNKEAANKAIAPTKTSDGVEKLPERQRSAMHSFLSSPTSMNWDDLVRSMREEMFIQTITIQPTSSDDSSLGSLGSGSSISSMDSSLSSKSSLRRTSTGRNSNGRKSEHTRNKRRSKKESLERKVERVLTGGRGRSKKSSDESHPLLGKTHVGSSNFVGGKRSAFSAVKKLPTIPSSPDTSKKIRNSSQPVAEQLPLSPTEGPSLIMSIPTTPSIPLVHNLSLPQSHKAHVSSGRTTSFESPHAVGEHAEDNTPFLLSRMPSTGDSNDDNDSFYNQIRGKSKKSSEKEVSSKAKSASAKTKAHNPFAFGNHPLLPMVVEEGNISPFPTSCWDGSDVEEEEGQAEVVDVVKHATEGMQVLGSFASSIGASATMDVAKGDVAVLAKVSDTGRTKKKNRAITILPASRSANRRVPTCWQLTRHRCRKTRAEI
eukprot:scaffold2107_cov192-Alexandrium_tamarense.AAC.19